MLLLRTYLYPLETPGDEALEENRRMMWQDKNQQELIQDKWTEFSSTTNEVFVPDDRAWAVAENAAVETDENGEQSGGFVFPLNFSLNSSRPCCLKGDYHKLVLLDLELNLISCLSWVDVLFDNLSSNFLEEKPLV